MLHAPTPFAASRGRFLLIAFRQPFLLQRPAWVTALFDCVESAMAHHKYSWAKTTCDILVKDIIDRRRAPTIWSSASWAIGRWWMAVLGSRAHQTYALLARTVPAPPRRQNFDEGQQRMLQDWNLQCKGQKVQRQQQHAQQRREMTSYERKEAEWRSAEISINKASAPSAAAPVTQPSRGSCLGAAALYRGPQWPYSLAVRVCP